MFGVLFSQRLLSVKGLGCCCGLFFAFCCDLFRFQYSSCFSYCIFKLVFLLSFTRIDREAAAAARKVQDAAERGKKALRWWETVHECILNCETILIHIMHIHELYDRFMQTPWRLTEKTSCFDCSLQPLFAVVFVMTLHAFRARCQKGHTWAYMGIHNHT